MKKGMWTIIIIVIIVIGIMCGISMSENDKENTQMTNSNVETNKQENEENANMINEIQEDETQNVIDENMIANEVNTETFDEEPKTEQDKAIQIVKKDYGTSSNIKFSVEGMDSNGRHVVVVRDINTTEALVFYFVNVNDETFTKKEMN